MALKLRTHESDEYRAMSAFGRDREGILGMLAAIVQRSGVNTVGGVAKALGGHASLFYVFSGNKSQLDELEQSAKRELGLHVFVEPTEAPSLPPDMQPVAHVCQIVVEDTPGFFGAIGAFLSKHDVSIIASSDERHVSALDSSRASCTVTHTLLVPKGFDRLMFLTELHMFGEEWGLISGTMELKR